MEATCKEKRNFHVGENSLLHVKSRLKTRKNFEFTVKRN